MKINGFQNHRSGSRWLHHNRFEALSVLMYHHVGPVRAGALAGLTIAPERFKRQMHWLKRRGFCSIVGSDWLAWRSSGKQLPAKPVMITFDDAYADLVRYAFPVLRDLGFKATVFVVTDEIGGKNSWDRETGSDSLCCMSGEQITYWSKLGIEFGVHSKTHADLTLLSDEQLEEEVAGSGRDLADLLGIVPSSFAYPYGFYNDSVLCTTRRRFQLAFTCDEGLNRLGTDLHLLHRTKVEPEDSLLDFILRVRYGFSAVQRVRLFIRAHPRLRKVLRWIKKS
ncbi:polysaccharide deacetylase family protein [bacterium]|nr:polysaccharide deacetylase family protein [bacterium]